jgi:hypothetical protein
MNMRMTTNDMARVKIHNLLTLEGAGTDCVQRLEMLRIAQSPSCGRVYYWTAKISTGPDVLILMAVTIDRCIAND